MLVQNSPKAKVGIRFSFSCSRPRRYQTSCNLISDSCVLMAFVATHLAVVEGGVWGGHLSIVLGFKSPLLATVWPPTGPRPFWQWHCSSSCCCSGCHWANSFSSKLELTVHERKPSGGYHQWVTTNNYSLCRSRINVRNKSRWRSA